ncbi:fatty acid synthase-like [Oratosquilla oratoria]|uniref:fatty acid synthase-like n=1 Tax=Oratosquilla oratoria TaxID=337810 RepID=UPI003F776274
MPAYTEVVPVVRHDSTSMGASLLPTTCPRRPLETVVVSGMSGRFPESSSIEEFAENLYGGVDMVTEDGRRWQPGVHGLPTRNGKIPDLRHFDASFFNVSPRQAHYMDPQLRILQELTYEAIIDAGVNPQELRGRRVGVYVGVSNSETEDLQTQDADNISGYGLTGCCRAMFANRISFAFDFKGPSYAVDTACSSSMVALQNAWSAISLGEIEAAVVAGAHLTLKPQSSMQFDNLGMLAHDGKCKAFDESGNGYVRSEAVVVVFLQKAQEANRVYAQVVHARTNTDGYKTEGVTFPSGAVQKELLQEVYNNSGIHPAHVSYVEAHGTGTKAGDPQELGALAAVLCKDRSTSSPLLLGSVKSNMGHSEPASGLCSIVKVLLAMQRREIPGNLHFRVPNPNIPVLHDGTIKVVNKNMSWSGGYAAINSFGFGGANVHVLLRSPDDISLHGEPVTPPPTPPKSNEANCISTLPRLVVASGRTEESLVKSLEGIRKLTGQDGAFTLLDHINERPILSHLYRGFVFVDEDSEPQVQSVPNTGDDTVPPVWFIYTGMGSQWVACGKELMAIPTFSRVIEKCNVALSPYGINLIDVITSSDPKACASTTKSFVAIAAVQVGLTEVLQSIGIVPSGMIGHSVGELGCAYGDGSLTAEQTVLAAFWRGKAVSEANLPPGAMAAVGLSMEEAEPYCKDGIIVACNNAVDSVTISGPVEPMQKLQEELEEKGVFCRSVKSEGVAFHHPSLQAAAPKLLQELKKLIPCPKTRSARWISSSVPEKSWNTSLAAAATPTYLVNNLLSPVLFANALEKVPKGAVVVEIAPHGLLQGILRRALPHAQASIPLVRKEAPSSLGFFLQSIGKLYMNGLQPRLRSLYPNVNLPVPSHTPTLSNLVSWDHSVEWDVATFTTSPSSSEYTVEVDLGSDEYKFLEGHTIDGRVIFPATGYMVLAWRALCRLKGVSYEDTPVTFSNVALHQATLLPPPGSSVVLSVRLLLLSGDFEVTVGETVAASGRVQLGAEQSPAVVMTRKNLATQNCHITDDELEDEVNIDLNQQDVYRELRLRGYQYQGVFKGILSANNKGLCGKIQWHGNWVSYLDTILQFSLLGAVGHRALRLPTRIRSFTVDPAHLQENLKQEDNIQAVLAANNPDVGVTVGGGVAMSGLKATHAPRKLPQDKVTLEKQSFVPYFLQQQNCESPETGLYYFLDLVLENMTVRRLKINHVLSDVASFIPSAIHSAMATQPLVQMDYTVFSDEIMQDSVSLENLENLGIAVTKEENLANSLSQPPSLLIVEHVEETLLEFLKNEDKTWVLLISKNEVDEAKKLKSCDMVQVAKAPEFGFGLWKKASNGVKRDLIFVDEKCRTFTWVEELKSKMLTPEDPKGSKLWLVSSDPSGGLLGLVNCLRREPGGERLRCIFDMTGTLDLSESNSSLWNERTLHDLAINVWFNGMWGSYRHCLLPPIQPQPTQSALLNVGTRGDLSSLQWYENPVLKEDDKRIDDLECHVSYAPLNFRDVMLATGNLPPDALPGDLAAQDCILGLEFAGVTKLGRRVMGLVPCRGLATHVYGHPAFTWTVPSHWSLRQAATVPVVYATAYYALVVRGALEEGDSVLIHSGSGGVGQAAISIALARGCTVFTTVGSEKKREFLKKRFPQLTDWNFANSRDSSFEFDVLKRTGGKGVDIVLNSLAGELLQASVRCLKEHGHFLEIGKADLSKNTPLGMAVFLKNVTFHGILLDALFDASPKVQKRLHHLLEDGIVKGEVVPLPDTVFTRSQVEDAFRFMASGKHIGKVLLEVRSEEQQKDSLSSFSIPAVPRTHARPDLVYVITGGLGGLGLELGDWLIHRGAKKLVLTSRKGISTGYQALCVRRWREMGVKVSVLRQDASDVKGAKELLKEAMKDGPVGGIFHLAMVLRDALLENQTPATFKSVIGVKGEGAKSLDLASRSLCPDLHMWVAFSSVSCGRGNAGQSNYGWANSECERVAEERRAQGLPGIAIQWGAVGDVGVLADTMGDVEVGGTLPQSLRSILATMDVLLQQNAPVVSSCCFAARHRKSDSSSSASLVAAVANILGVKDLSTVRKDVTLGDLGLDSLMSVEVKQTLEREADVVLNPSEVRQLTLGAIEKLYDTKELSDGSSVDEKGRSSGSSRVGSPMPPTNIDYPWLTLPLITTKTIAKLNEVTSSTTPLFVASPIQGMGVCLKEVAADIGLPVFALQYPGDVTYSSIPELARSLIKEILQIHPEGPLHIAGYSFGATVAFEIALQLQALDRPPKSLIFLDGSHSYVAGVVDTYRNRKGKLTSAKNDDEIEKYTSVEEQTNALITFALQFFSSEYAVLRTALMALGDWKERVNHVAEMVEMARRKAGCAELDNTRQQILEAARQFVGRLQLGLDYADVEASGRRWTGPALLIKATNNTHTLHLGKSYGLDKVVTGRLSVVQVDGNHESFIMEEGASSVSTHINAFLSTV